MNLPVDVGALQALLPAGLKPDIFNGSAWISVDVDTFAKLEKVFLGAYVNTFTGGSGFLKVTFLVTSALYGPGYFIHELDFGSYLLTLGCKATQSFTCSYSKIKTSSSRSPLSIDVHSTSGRQMHASFTKLTRSFTNKHLVSFVLGRKTKYAQTGGKLIAVNQFPPSSSSSYPLEVQTLQLDGEADLGLLRLGENLPKMVAGWSICDVGSCFLQPSYTLIDHVAGHDVPSAFAAQPQLIV